MSPSTKSGAMYDLWTHGCAVRLRVLYSARDCRRIDRSAYNDAAATEMVRCTRLVTERFRAFSLSFAMANLGQSCGTEG